MQVDASTFRTAIEWVKLTPTKRTDSDYFILNNTSEGLFLEYNSDVITLRAPIRTLDEQRPPSEKNYLPIHNTVALIRGISADEEVSLDFSSEHKITVSGKNAKFNIPLLKKNPRKILQNDTVTVATVDAQEFLDSLTHVSLLCSTEQGAPSLSSVQVRAHKDSLEMVATNRYVIGKFLVSAQTGDFSQETVFLVEGKLASLIKPSIVGSGDIEIIAEKSLSNEQNFSRFGYMLADGRSVMYNLIEAQPLSVAGIIDNASNISDNYFTIATSALQSSVNIISQFDIYGKEIKFILDENGLVLEDIHKSSSYNVDVKELYGVEDDAETFLISRDNMSRLFASMKTKEIQGAVVDSKKAPIKVARFNPVDNNGTVDNTRLFICTTTKE